MHESLNHQSGISNTDNFQKERANVYWQKYSFYYLKDDWDQNESVSLYLLADHINRLHEEDRSTCATQIPRQNHACAWLNSISVSHKLPELTAFLPLCCSFSIPGCIVSQCRHGVVFHCAFGDVTLAFTAKDPSANNPISWKSPKSII